MSKVIQQKENNLFESLINTIIPHAGFLSLTLAAIQCVFFGLFLYTNVPGYQLSLSGIFSMLGAFITLLSFSLLIESLGHARIVRAILSLSVIIFGVLLYSYNLSSLAPVDFSLVKDNAGIAFSWEALTVMASAFKPSLLIATGVLFILCIVFEIRFCLLSGKGQNHPLLPKIIFALLFWASSVFIPFPVKDQFTMFAESIIASYRSTTTESLVEGYPYAKNSIEASSIRKAIPTDKTGKPNIFLIMIESLNANFIESKDSLGREYTPNINSLIKTGVYVERFYGNSIQTCKGQEAAFFSIIPSINGKLFVDYPNLDIKGFPALLSQQNYSTVFFQAYHDLNFDNTGTAMKKAGFTTVETFARYKKKEDKKNIWGWGVEDGTFYTRFFEALDTHHATSPQSPIFAALATVGTHIPCDGMPAEKMMKTKKPKNIRERYENALALSDEQLKIFMSELEKRDYLANSIIIITSDHSFPMKEHGIYNNEICRYEEAFRIPFLVIWKDVLTAQRIDYPCSQVDIGPTIMDLAGITNEKNTLVGKSIFINNTQRTVHLVQPYNGRYLEAINFPFKYVYHERTKTEIVFNLEKDPMETSDILTTISSHDMKKFRKDIEAIRINQKLIEENRITPSVM